MICNLEEEKDDMDSNKDLPGNKTWEPIKFVESL